MVPNKKLVDPPGSALYNKIEHGVAYASQQQERSLRRHRCMYLFIIESVVVFALVYSSFPCIPRKTLADDTLAEGIGLDRITHNFALGLDSIDRAIRVTDQEAVDMAHWLLSTEGLWVGSSSAMNVVGAIRTAQDLPQQSTIVTVICDGGQRHATRFWNPVFIREWGLKWPGGSEPDEKERIPVCLHAVLKR
jgi:cysteine synthase